MPLLMPDRSGYLEKAELFGLGLQPIEMAKMRRL
jgi:hypothetical protein